MCLIPLLLERLEQSGEAPVSDVLSRRSRERWSGVIYARVLVNYD